MSVSLGVSFAGDMPAKEILRLAELADAVGLGHLWLTEDMFFRAPMPTAGAIAIATHQISIGFGVLTMYNRHPAVTVMEMASLCELAGPRVILGIGGGVGRRLRHLGVVGHAPVSVVRDALLIARGLAAGEPFDHEGVVHQAMGLQLSVRPPANLPLYVAALGPNALRQAGRLADGLILGIMTSAAWAAEARRIALSERTDSPPFPTVVFTPAAVSETNPDDARASVKHLVGHYAQRWVGVPMLEDLFTRWGDVTPAQLADMAARLERREAASAVVPDSMVDTYCLAGSTGDIRTRIASYEAAGVTHLAATIDAATPDPAALIRALGTIERDSSPPITRTASLPGDQT